MSTRLLWLGVGLLAVVVAAAAFGLVGLIFVVFDLTQQP
jgi:hypothetical protein